MYKKTISRVACLALLLTLQCLPLRGQQLAPDSVMVKYENLVQTLTDFSNNIPREKVYLHFDNTSYYRNDNIWFKCYIVSPGANIPSALSKTLYVELLNPGGEVVDKRILKVVDGQCHGDFRLNHLPFYSGFYEVRAYTKYMLNFGEGAIFSRLFPVYDQPAVTGDYKERTMTDYDRSSLDFPMKRVPPLKGGGVGGGALNLKFFPEGGRLVRGVPSRLAFEATDETGSPIDITGVVVSDTGTDEPARTFASSRLGRGVFTYTPPAGKGDNEEVEVEYAGRKYRFPLPGTAAEGVTMRVDNVSQPGTIAVTLLKNQTTPDRTLGVAVMSGGKLCTGMFVGVKGNRVSLKIAETELPAGVAQIVLFDEDGNIVCDRLVFIPCRDRLNITATTDKKQYQPLERVEMNLSVTDLNDNPAGGVTFSLAVRDGNDHIRYRSNIMADMLLSSEIRGYVRDPLYYFESDDTDRRQALDLLLMVQGWRRYSWEQMTGREPLEHEYLPEQGIETRGRVIKEGLLSGRETPVPEAQVSIMLTRQDEQAADGSGNKQLETGYAETDGSGQFNFMSGASGKWDMVFGITENGNKKDYRVILDRFPAPVPRRYDLTDLAPAETEADGESGESGESGGSGGGMYGGLSQARIDSMVHGMALGDSIRLIDAVTFAAKRRTREDEIYHNRSTSTVYYDVLAEMDKLYDSGEYYQDIHSFLKSVNSNFFVKGIGTNGELLYKNKTPLVIINYNPVEWGTDDMEIYKAFDPDGVKAVYINEDINVMAQYVKISEEGASREFGELGQGASSAMSLTPQTIARDYLGCVVFIETYDEGEFPKRPARGVRRTLWEGYSTPGEFYSPDYSVLPPDNDYRRTLYWNPNVTTDEAGRANVEFYNNSRATRFNISTETVSPDGRIGVYAK